jgi:hypothetical protein
LPSSASAWLAHILFSRKNNGPAEQVEESAPPGVLATQAIPMSERLHSLCWLCLPPSATESEVAEGGSMKPQNVD